MGESGGSWPNLSWICRAALRAQYPQCPQFRDFEISASFYPYVGLTHTIRKRDGAWIIRISDLCRNAPRVVLEAIAVMLGAKILRRKPPRAMLGVYGQFRREPVIEDQLRARLRRRGRKIMRPGGRHHQLDDILAEVNRRYFGSRVEIERIGWSARRSWGRIGHYDPVHLSVTISPVLDSPRVPRAVVAFLVYHELLHTLYDDHCAGGARKHHPPEFRAAEKAHPDYEFARSFIREFCGNRGRSGRGRLDPAP